MVIIGSTMEKRHAHPVLEAVRQWLWDQQLWHDRQLPWALILAFALAVLGWVPATVKIQTAMAMAMAMAMGLRGWRGAGGGL